MVIFALHKLIIYGAFTIVQAIQNILKSRFWIWHFYNIMIYYYRHCLLKIEFLAYAMMKRSCTPIDMQCLFIVSKCVLPNEIGP